MSGSGLGQEGLLLFRRIIGNWNDFVKVAISAWAVRKARKKGVSGVRNHSLECKA